MMKKFDPNRIANQVFKDPSTAEISENPMFMVEVINEIVIATTEDTLDKAVQYGIRLPTQNRYHQALLFRDLYRRFGSRLAERKAYVDWYHENKKLFGVDE